MALWALEEASRIVMSSLRELGETSSPLYHVRGKKLKRDDDVYDLGRDMEIPNKFDISAYFDPTCVEPLGSQSTTSSPDKGPGSCLQLGCDTGLQNTSNKVPPE
jgi:hypothetical protein